MLVPSQTSANIQHWSAWNGGEGEGWKGSALLQYCSLHRGGRRTALVAVSPLGRGAGYEGPWHLPPMRDAKSLTRSLSGCCSPEAIPAAKAPTYLGSIRWVTRGSTAFGSLGLLLLKDISWRTIAGSQRCSGQQTLCIGKIRYFLQVLGNSSASDM